MRASFVKTFSAAAACSVLALAATTASAQETKLAIGISGWTGYAPLSLAQKEGIFKKHGLDVDIKMIPQKDRHLALASNSIQCAATTVQTHMAWTQMGVPITQIFLMDKSTGADGLVVRDGIKSFADLKGKTIAVDATGTTPYFMLASMLKKNGMSLKDVKLSTLSPQAAAQAFVAGQNDAAVTYEPYLSTVRDNPKAGRIMATTKDYPVVIDTFGCAPKWLAANPKAAQALTNSWFEALEMIKANPKKAYEVMGAEVKQSGDDFAKSASYLTFSTKAENQQFFAKEIIPFMQNAAKIFVENGVMKKEPANYNSLINASFIK